jgi:phospholipid transport system substrate-binding protein
MKRVFSTLILLACSTGLVAAPDPAPPVPAPHPPQIQDAPSPLVQLRVAVESLMAFMNREPIPAPSAVARYLDEQVAPMFDFRTMARAAGGRFYQTLSPQQQDAMAEEIKRLFLTRLTIGLAGYDGQEVHFLRPRLSPDGDEAMISMAIVNPGHYPARIDFRLAFHGRDWRIIDIAANGTSAVVYYRQMLLREAMSRIQPRAPQYRGNYPGPARRW